MSEKISASEAVDFAKSYWPMDDGEPLIPSGVVQLRELCFALQRILSGPLEEKEKWKDMTAFWLVLEALKDGGLVAKTFATDTIIPYYSWSSVDVENGNEAFASDYWFGEISDDSDCHGFRGQLPVVKRTQAEEWLRNWEVDQSIGGIVNHSDVAARDRAFLEWAEDFPEGEIPLVFEREEWGRLNLVNGKKTSRETIRDLVSEHAPAKWSKPGRKPCIPGRKSRNKVVRYDKRRYRRRNRIERMFGRLKDWRRVSTRYDRCPKVFLSAIALAATVIFWL